MPRDVIPFRRPTAAHPADAGPNIAFATLPALHRLMDALKRAIRFRDECRRMQQKAAGRWGVPRLFFFNRTRQTEWEAVRGPEPTFPDPWALSVARRRPDDAQAWADLRTWLDDALTLCAGEPAVRRAARALPGLVAAAESLAPDHPKTRRFADMLAVPDDLLVTALHPDTRAGVRVRLAGVADLFQFHVLLADAVCGRLLPGRRPDRHITDAYRDSSPEPESVATASFQMYKPAALVDGQLPPPFAGSDHWLWGHESPVDIPTLNGERVVLLGDPPYPRQWPVERKVRLLAGEVRVVDVLTATQVDAWLGDQSAKAPRRAA